ncbi:MAG: DUF2306 domain-containing protein [Bryobacteraceae bacterium]
MQPSKSAVTWMWTATIFLACIGLAVVIRRSIVLYTGPGTGYNAELDIGFAQHPRLTLVHIIPGFFFMLLGPMQFVRRIRARMPAVHRWIGRIFLSLGLVIGITAFGLGFQTSIGGVNETVATTLFALLFLFSLCKAYIHARRREFAPHREWMIRAFAIGLAVATIRPIIGVFFATSHLTGLTPHEFFGTGFWLGFTLQTIAAEVWINHTRPAPARVAAIM